MANVDEIRILIKKRGTIKAQITSFKRFLVKSREEEILDAPRITQRIRKLKEVMSNFDKLCDEIDQVDLENDHTAERITIEEDYLDLISDAEKIISTNNQPIIIHDVDNDGHAAEASENIVQTRKFRLPEVALPKFDGKFENWLGFKDSFLSIIGNRNDISNVEKLQYLKGSLTGEAVRKLTIFTLTNENYERAWKLLHESYEDKRLIITRHIDLLIHLPVQDREIASGITRLADEAQQHMLSLQSLDVNVSEPMVVQLIVNKLHKITRQKWEESLQRGVFPQLEKLFEFLYATASRIAQWDREDRGGSSNKSTKPSSTKSLGKSVKTLVTTTNNKCSVCSEDAHPLYKCEKFRSLGIPVRIKIVKDASLCLNCLRSHGTKACKFRGCLRCNEPHNTLLHEENSEPGTSTNQA